MFVVVSTHLRPLAAVDVHLQDHFAFLDRAYAAGVYLASGRREPRNGAVILADAKDRETLEAWLRQDPFIAAGVARYELFEFVPGRAAPDLASLVERSAPAK